MELRIQRRTYGACATHQRQQSECRIDRCQMRGEVDAQPARSRDRRRRDDRKHNQGKLGLQSLR
jgi:hypothetical protein